ncbi:MAG TPA: hypothetical protein V6C63_19475 [Allocoleopsis sp.]
MLLSPHQVLGLLQNQAQKASCAERSQISGVLPVTSCLRLARNNRVADFWDL